MNNKPLPQIAQIDWDEHEKNAVKKEKEKEQPKITCQSCGKENPCLSPMHCPNFLLTL